MRKKTPNHELSAAKCPVSLGDVDLFAPGNTFLHQPGIMLGTLELRLEFDRTR